MFLTESRATRHAARWSAGGKGPTLGCGAGVVRYMPDVAQCHEMVKQGLPEVFTSDLEMAESDLHAFYRALERKLDELCDIAMSRGMDIA